MRTIFYYFAQSPLEKKINFNAFEIWKNRFFFNFQIKVLHITFVHNYF
jgi:hypothetical protein